MRQDEYGGSAGEPHPVPARGDRGGPRGGRRRLRRRHADVVRRAAPGRRSGSSPTRRSGWPPRSPARASTSSASIRGRADTDAELARAIPPMGTPASPHLEFAGWVRKRVDVPVMHAARIADVATARHAVAAGLRGPRRHDPGAHGRPGPAVEGRRRSRRSRAAVRRREHVPRQHLHLGLGGVHPQPGDRSRAGAAAAGGAGRQHEAVRRRRRRTGRARGRARARRARARGDACTRRAPRSAGRSRWRRRAERRRDLIGIIDWRVAECRRLGVDLHRDHYVEPDEITDGGRGRRGHRGAAEHNGRGTG